MRRVFVIEEPRARFDPKKVSDFGEIKLVFTYHDRRPSIFQPNEFGDAIIERLEARDFDPSNDMVCVAGSMIGVALLLMIIIARWHQVDLLMFNARTENYVLRRFQP